MSKELEYPKLRWPIDIRMHTVEGQQILLLNCPIGIHREPLALNPAIAPVLGTFDGANSRTKILERFTSHGLTPELLDEIVSLLESRLFLETPRFFEAQKKIKEEFLLSDVRPAALAGVSYPAIPGALEMQIDSYLACADKESSSAEKQLLGLVAPHIDYARGGSCYGKSYARLKNTEHDLYILIGTSHQYSRRLFHLTRKSFASPLGTLNCDVALVDQIARSYGIERSFTDEFLHRNEHSLELQVPFLKRLKQSPRILPILVGSFHKMLHAGKPLSEFAEYEDFVGAIAEALQPRIAEGSRVCIISGVDMAHIGGQFGDSKPLTPEWMREIETRDQLYLSAIVKQDKQALLSHIAEDDDARRICGFPTMYTVLDLFDRLSISYSAEVIDYSQAINYEASCAVTFSGVALYA